MKLKELKKKISELQKLKRKPTSTKSNKQSCYPLKQSRRCQRSTEGRISEKGMFWSTNKTTKVSWMVRVVRTRLVNRHDQKEEMLTRRQYPPSGTRFIRWIASWAASGTEYLSNTLPSTLKFRLEITPNCLNAISRSLLVQFWFRFSITILQTNNT